MLRIQVTDAGTGKLTPCRLHIRLADGSCWVPAQAGEPVYTETVAPDLLLPSHFDHGLHICEGADIQSVHLNHGRATLSAPPGPVEIRIAKGHEYVPVTERFRMTEQALDRSYQLERLIDMPAQGWYGGDPHVHLSRADPSDDYMWLRWMAAEDLYAVNSMVFKHHGAVEQAPQYAMGTASHCQWQGRVLASGEEFRDGDLYGHMILAGIREVVEPISVGLTLTGEDNYPVFATACDEAHRQGGVVGWAHGGGVFNRLHESLPIEAALGKVDFVEVIQFNMFFGHEIWRVLVNCGIPLACAAGSDFPFCHDLLAPWIPNFGLDRTYAHVEGEFTYDKWLQGIRTGKCFATNGPMVSLTVNGQPLGSQLRLPSSEREVDVVARAVCNYPLDHLDILVNGGTVRRVDAGGGQRDLSFHDRIRLPESAWLAACARGTVAPDAYGGVHPWQL